MHVQTSYGEYGSLGAVAGPRSEYQGNCGERTLLWSRNLNPKTQLTSRICGAYTNLLHKALSILWATHMTNRRLQMASYDTGAYTLLDMLLDALQTDTNQ